MRNLTLDLYCPQIPTPGALRPALIMAFGGAFHRGSKADDAFGEPPHRNHSIAWYCKEFAQLGFVTCSIDYRLVPENPEPGSTVVVSSPDNIPRSRVDAVREIMGLPPACAFTLWRGVEAASDDMALAVRYIRHHAAQWSIDPTRIAAGGFSAGARTALNAAFGEQEPIAAVVALSGYMHLDDLRRHIASSRSMPRVLCIYAENDLDYVTANCPGMIRCMRSLGVHCESALVPGATHFYPADSRALHDQSGPTTVKEAMENFLIKAMTA